MITPQEALQRTIEHREIFHDEIRRDLGALSIPTMSLVAAGLRAALAI